MERNSMPSIAEFVKATWNEVKIFQISEEQKNELKNSSLLDCQKYSIREGTNVLISYSEEPRLLIIERGEIRHLKLDYTQNTNDLCVIPPNMSWTARAEKDLTYYLIKFKLTYKP